MNDLNLDDLAKFVASMGLELDMEQDIEDDLEQMSEAELRVELKRLYVLGDAPQGSDHFADSIPSEYLLSRVQTERYLLGI